MTPPLVAIIVLTWNQRDLTLACLDSLAALDYPADSVQVIIVDNGSTDGTAEVVRAQYPQVRVLVNTENLGFAEGNNAGIKLALADGADYVLLLNNDTVVNPPFLRELITVAESDPQIGIIGPKIYYHDDPEMLCDAGNIVDWRTGTLLGLHADEPGTLEDTPYQVDYVTGCALCIKRNVVEKIGLLDPRFFFYYEETDWCARAKAAGFYVMAVPRSRIWHRVAATIGCNSPAMTYYMTRNLFLFLGKNLQGYRLLTALTVNWLREMRTVTAHTLKPCYRPRHRNRDARVLALRDALLGRWGKMGPDVEAVCYPEVQ